jgi:peptide/nickel transport system ATP-binding protein
MEQRNIVEVNNLEVKFYTYAGVVEALDGVNLFIKEGEILGLVGETGCGKSVTSLSIMRLVPPPGKIEGGKIFFNGENKQTEILSLNDESIRRMRGQDVAMIFQEPRAYLNPVYTVGDQIAEIMLVHRKGELLEKSIDSVKKRLMDKNRSRIQKRISQLEKKKANLERQMVELGKRSGTQKQKARLEKQKAKLDKQIADIPSNYVPSNYEIRVYRRLLKANSRAARLAARIFSRFNRKRQFTSEIRKEVVRVLKSVEIPDPERVAGMYPHELSGGMAQRVVIAMALACNPKLLIADEPTTNLDVTVQAQILNLVKVLKKNLGSSILYITHDLGVVAQSCDRVAVMYAGNVVETADVLETFSSPLHPYTIALLASIPRPGQPFKSIPGIVPSLINPLPGCRFHDRCPYALDMCVNVKPAFTEVKPGHYVSCHLYGGPK